MNFWDTSALVALDTGGKHGDSVRRTLEEDGNVALWWGAHVEYAAAVSRRERERLLTAQQAATLLRRFNTLAESCHEVQPAPRIRLLAQRLLRVHPLKAADALQLAAALTVAEDDPASIGFVCLDIRLNRAAAREGFTILGL